MEHSFEGQHPRIASDVWVAPGAHIIGDVEIGPQSSVWFNTVIRGDVFHVRIGARVNIQDASVIHVTTGRNATIIEDDVTVGHRALLHGCTVHSHCLIGMGAIVLDRAVIGEFSLIGAGALVTEGTIIPPGSLVLGAPAKVRRALTEEERQGIVTSVETYVRLAARYRAGRETG